MKRPPKSVAPEVDETMNSPPVGSDDPPFELTKPRLISQRPQGQVILCNYSPLESRRVGVCVFKVFSILNKTAFEREVSVYAAIGDANLGVEIAPSKLWSGAWQMATYRQFLGHIPPVTAGSETRVYAIMLEFVDSISWTQILSTSRSKRAARAALQSLQTLHLLRIAHHDILQSNVLLRNMTGSSAALWIDFSTSQLGATTRVLATEWRKATNYFANLVNPLWKAH